MELYFAGGVGEHGRNCFYVRGESVCFLVDCGVMAESPDDRYPRLSQEQIDGIDAVFLTHSHADHTGALPWLAERGFSGPVFAAGETLRQLPTKAANSFTLETICPGGRGGFAADAEGLPRFPSTGEEAGTAQEASGTVSQRAKSPSFSPETIRRTR